MESCNLHRPTSETNRHTLKLTKPRNSMRPSERWNRQLLASETGHFVGSKREFPYETPYWSPDMPEYAFLATQHSYIPGPIQLGSKLWKVPILSYHWVPRPPMRVKCLPPKQEFFYQPPMERYVYQPPAEEVLVEQPPELYYLPQHQAYYYQPPPQRVTFQLSWPPDVDVTYGDTCQFTPHEYESPPTQSVFWTDPRAPPIFYGVRTIPSPIRIYHPRELPLKG